MTLEIDFIPDRLNQEPIIFIGMTNSELKLAAVLSVVVCVPISTVLGFFLGAGLVGFSIGIALAFGLMFLVGRRLRGLKRGRPEGYHIDAIHAWLEDKGLRPKSMIRESRVWDIVRRK